MAKTARRASGRAVEKKIPLAVGAGGATIRKVGKRYARVRAVYATRQNAPAYNASGAGYWSWFMESHAPPQYLSRTLGVGWGSRLTRDSLPMPFGYLQLPSWTVLTTIPTVGQGAVSRYSTG